MRIYCVYSDTDDTDDIDGIVDIDDIDRERASQLYQLYQLYQVNKCTNGVFSDTDENIWRKGYTKYTQLAPLCMHSECLRQSPQCKKASAEVIGNLQNVNNCLQNPGRESHIRPLTSLEPELQREVVKKHEDFKPWKARIQTKKRPGVHKNTLKKVADNCGKSNYHNHKLQKAMKRGTFRMVNNLKLQIEALYLVQGLSQNQAISGPVCMYKNARYF